MYMPCRAAVWKQEDATYLQGFCLFTLGSLNGRVERFRLGIVAYLIDSVEKVQVLRRHILRVGGQGTTQQGESLLGSVARHAARDGEVVVVGDGEHLASVEELGVGCREEAEEKSRWLHRGVGLIIISWCTDFVPVLEERDSKT
jgi:hypothetical protein